MFVFLQENNIYQPRPLNAASYLQKCCELLIFFSLFKHKMLLFTEFTQKNPTTLQQVRSLVKLEDWGYIEK